MSEKRRETERLVGSDGQGPEAKTRADPRTQDRTVEVSPGRRGSPEVAPSWQGLSALGTAERYTVRGTLGEGGMGEVLLVTDEVIGREVAMKVIRRERRGTVERFLTEAKVQARLEHPLIVPLYDVGVREDASIFFTMKRVRGESLWDILDRRATGGGCDDEPVTPRRLLAAFAQVCLAVHYAHERGVIHRDLKPSNIMLGSYGEVYVIDWGVAKIVGATDEDIVSASDSLRFDEDADLTGAQDMLGTPGYMSPEQIRSSAAHVDARSDVYALGAILFEIIGQGPLHPGRTAKRRIDSTLEGADPARRLTELRVDAPPELVVACTGATALDPRRRTATARELADAIEAYLEGDRNLQLRRDLADQYAASARRALGDVDTESIQPSERSRVLHDVGQALALDPDNRSALRTFVDLLTTPPRTVPEEVQQQARVGRLRQLRAAALVALAIYAFTAANAPLVAIFIGGTSPSFYAAEACWFVAIGCCVLAYFRPSYTALFATLTAAVSACVFLTQVFSPLLLVPLMFAAHAVIYCLMHGWWRRIVVLAIVLGGLTLSVFGEWFGLFRDSVRFVDEGILIASIGTFDATATNLYIYASTVAIAVLSAVVLGLVRSRAAQHELAVRLQAWQLRQLVGDQAPETTTLA